MKMAEETKVIEQLHSCKIAINAKGMWSGEVKVYDLSPESARRRASDEAYILEKLIKEKNGLK